MFVEYKRIARYFPIGWVSTLFEFLSRFLAIDHFSPKIRSDILITWSYFHGFSDVGKTVFLVIYLALPSYARGMNFSEVCKILQDGRIK
jgi:hypothetical protein